MLQFLVCFFTGLALMLWGLWLAMVHSNLLLATWQACLLCIITSINPVLPGCSVQSHIDD